MQAMKTMGVRITAWHALTVTGLLVALFLAGHVLLQRYLVQQLDALNEAQFNHLRATLGKDYADLKPAEIDERIRAATESASALFYVDMHGPMTNRFFRSRNLQARSIPDLVGQKRYSVPVDGIGDLRVGEYMLAPLDVMIASPLAPVEQLMAAYRRVFLGLLLAALALSVLFGYALSEVILRPVRSIQETATRIRADNLAARIPVGRADDEISRLAIFLNQTFDRLAFSFAEIRRFAAEASHELKTPLSLVQLHAERLLVAPELTAAERDSVLVQLEELARVNQLIDEMLFLSRADAGAVPLQAQATSIPEFLGAFATDACALAEHGGRSFTWTHHGADTWCIDRKRIRQVLMNLLANAMQVSPAGGVVHIDSTLTEGSWQLSVVDEGPGLAPEQCACIFDRFVRLSPADGAERGAGLGLPIARSIVALHGGRIWATSRDVGRGLRVAFELPRKPAAAG
jgi:two-component system heavy metal sensor histidine kinase CusS